MDATLSHLKQRGPIRPKMAIAPRASSLGEDVRASPVIKWAGGKKRLLAEIQKRLPKTYCRYFEPFAGGAAVFFHNQPKNAVLADQNPDLINMYRYLAWNVEGIIRQLQVHRSCHSQDYYYQTRERWNQHDIAPNSQSRAAAFIYLNKTCFNGLWRVNKSGEFNVPMGRYKNPSIVCSANLRAAAKILRQTKILHADYQITVKNACAGDFIYLDPPYDPRNKTSHFTSYTAGNFDKADQERLSGLVHNLVSRGCYVLVSNNDTPFIRELYRGLRVDRVQCTRAINCNAKSRGAVDEVLIRNL